MKFKTAIALTLQAGLLSSFSQGFINLNFENVTITSSSPSQFGFNYGTANVAGWTEYYGWNDVNYSGGTSLIYNNIPLDSEGVSIMDTNGPAPAIQGRYSILLEGATASGVIAYPWMTNGAAIGQTGQIPSSANSIIYWASDLNNGGLQVSFNGQALSFTDVSNTANYSVWVADISPYAGQTGELLFSTPSPNGEAMLDNIQFSANPAPEPGTLALAALGSLLLAHQGRKGRTSKLR